MEETLYAQNLYKQIATSPKPSIEARIQDKRELLSRFLSENGVIPDAASRYDTLLTNVAILSEVGYSMRTVISSPLNTMVEVGGDKFDFAISPDKGQKYPFNQIFIRSINYKDDVVFMFYIAEFIGGFINGVPVDFRG